MKLSEIMKKKISTDDCKKFLVDFFTKNPSMIDGSFHSDPQVLSWAKNKSEWKRIWKVGSKSEFIEDQGDELSIYKDVCTNPKGWLYERMDSLPKENVACIRLFACNIAELEDALQFLVIEDHNGKLYLGDSYGD